MPAVAAVLSTRDAPEDHQVLPFSITIALQSVTIFVVCARLFTRIFITQKAGADDWLILAAAFFSIAYTVLLGVCWAAGAGQHIHLLAVEQIIWMARVAWISGLVNIVALTLVRFSLLLFFLRLFPSRTVRTVTTVLIGFSAAFGTSMFFAALFQCRPVGAEVQHCFNLALFYQCVTVISMVLDFAILLTPIPSLYHAVLPLRARISIMLVFLIGFVPCVGSVFRVYFAAQSGVVDFTYVLAIQLTWCSIELHLSIICACVAGLKPLFARYLPTLIGSSWLSSNTGPQTTGRVTGAFGTSAVRSRSDTVVELRNLGDGATGGNGEVFNIQIKKSTTTATYMDGQSSMLEAGKVDSDRDDASQYEPEAKRQ